MAVGEGAGRLLVVEDDAAMQALLAIAAAQDGLVTEAASSVAAAYQALHAGGEWSLALVDVDLPDGDGFAVLEEAQSLLGLPVILLTAHAEAERRVRAFDLGADDYVVKPFDIRELLGRMRAVLRRAGRACGPVISIGQLVIDSAAQRAFVAGAEIVLTHREMQLLMFLARHPGRVFSRDELLRAVWQSSSAWQDVRTVNEHVRRLRIKLGPIGGPYLVTVRGGGYGLFGPGASEPGASEPVFGLSGSGPGRR